MGDKTGIEWTDATWNPIVGCSIVSPGCTNCYAMKMAGRLINGDRASLTFAEAALIYVDDGHRDLYLAPLIRHFRDQPVAAITAGHIRAAARVLYPEANTTEGLIAEVFGTFESQCRAGFVPGRLRLTQVSLCPIYRT